MFGLKRTKTSALEAMKKLFGEVLPTCSVCNGPISGHTFKEIAVTPIEPGNPRHALVLVNAVKQLEWERILSFQEFNGLLPAVVVYALRCPDNKCSLVAILDQSEFWEPDQFLHQQPTQDCERLGEDGYLGPL